MNWQSTLRLYAEIMAEKCKMKQKESFACAECTQTYNKKQQRQEQQQL